jgi:hypothetical protein
MRVARSVVVRAGNREAKRLEKLRIWRSEAVSPAEADVRREVADFQNSRFSGFSKADAQILPMSGKKRPSTDP